MFAIIGAAGKVGLATSLALREAGVPVRAILRDTTKADQFTKIGCEIAVADIQDAHALAKAIGNADVVQLILPPRLQAKDGAQDMRETIESIATAVEQAKPRRLLAISDYGAHIEHDIGMPTMCRAFEDRLRQLPGGKIFLRSTFHMQNWARSVPVAVASGNLPSFYDPTDMPHPTISAPDLGKIAADILLQPGTENEFKIVHAEGPRRYSAKDVAMALSELLGRSIDLQAVPRSQWESIMEQGMSSSLAALLIKASDAENKGGLVDVEPDAGEIRYGTTELIDALRPMIAKP